MTRHRNRLNILLVGLSVFSLLLLLSYVYQQRKALECQARVNAVYLQTLKERGALSDSYFDSFDRLIIGVFTARDRQDSMDAYEQYQNDRDQYLLDREAAQYPNYVKVCQ